MAASEERDDMSERQRISSGTVWEERVGYSRAVRVGNLVFVAGTTATGEDGSIVGVGDAEAQARFILGKIRWALEQTGATMADVVRYRCYVTNIDDWQACGRALHEAFATIRPASTLLAIDALVDPQQLVEIEVDAVIEAG
jgi:enamine deaminase RidA (YjgF/YER057c/UK114 family)